MFSDACWTESCEPGAQEGPDQSLSSSRLREEVLSVQPSSSAHDHTLRYRHHSNITCASGALHCVNPETNTINVQILLGDVKLRYF